VDRLFAGKLACVGTVLRCNLLAIRPKKCWVAAQLLGMLELAVGHIAHFVELAQERGLTRAHFHTAKNIDARGSAKTL
jgi:hypothetical protein